MAKQPQSIDSLIFNGIVSRGAGHVFTAADFLRLGSRDAVDQALSRQARSGAIRKLARGLYDLPQHDPQLGTLLPSIDAITAALRGRHAVRLQPTGAYAANLLGLSDQVPMRIVFLTDGLARHVRVGNQQIVLKRTTPRNMATAGRTSGLVIQALRYLGQRRVDDEVVNVLRSRLSPDERRQLLRDVQFAPAWVADVMRRVAVGLT
jgi:hypothetical protein